MVFKASVGRRLGVGASHKPRHRGRRDSDEYGVVGVREAVALDRHRRPGCRANGGDGGSLGRTGPVAVARDPAGDKEKMASRRRKPRGGSQREAPGRW
jgi:hypothetical protein